MLDHVPSVWALPCPRMDCVCRGGTRDALCLLLVLLSAFQERHCGLTSAPSTVSSRALQIQALFKPSGTLAGRTAWEAPRAAAKSPSSLLGQAAASQAPQPTE